MVKHNTSRLVSYEGYMVDLMEQLSVMLNFNYVLNPVVDGKYGHRRGDGTWDGMIGEILNEVRNFSLHVQY